MSLNIFQEAFNSAGYKINQDSKKYDQLYHKESGSKNGSPTNQTNPNYGSFGPSSNKTKQVLCSTNKQATSLSMSDKIQIKPNKPQITFNGACKTVIAESFAFDIIENSQSENSKYYKLENELDNLRRLIEEERERTLRLEAENRRLVEEKEVLKNELTKSERELKIIQRENEEKLRENNELCEFRYQELLIRKQINDTKKSGF